MQNVSRRLKLRKFALAKWKCARRKKPNAVRQKMPVAKQRPKPKPSARQKKMPLAPRQKRKPKRLKKSAKRVKLLKLLPHQKKNLQSGPPPGQMIVRHALATALSALAIVRHAQATVRHGLGIALRVPVIVRHALGTARRALGIVHLAQETVRHALVEIVQAVAVQVASVREPAEVLPHRIRMPRASRGQKPSSLHQNAPVRKIRTAINQPSQRAMIVAAAG